MTKIVLNVVAGSSASIIKKVLAKVDNTVIKQKDGEDLNEAVERITANKIERRL